MSKRGRTWVIWGAAVVVGVVLGQASDAYDWSLATLLAAEAGVIVVFTVPALFWIDTARDGALRRRPRS